jgi:hypothetical protein
LHTRALDFPTEFIRLLTVSNSENACDRFAENGWCNCHGNFKIRIGIAEGKGIIYEDINGNPNVAGKTINMAARVMGLADPMQIIFTEEAYRSLIDMTTDVSIENNFFKIDDVMIKHNDKIAIFLYADDAVVGLNNLLPNGLMLKRRMNTVLEASGFPLPSQIDISTEEGRKRMDELLSGMEALIR